MKLLIFGANGMLGRYLDRYLREKHEAIPITRQELDVYSAFESGKLTQDLTTLLQRHSPDYVINACGVINKRPDLPVTEMYVVNGYFPLVLSSLCKQMKIRLIHPSTGCVYSGHGTMYRSRDTPDCFDDYGASKAVAELIPAMVIRVSIIGEEVNVRSLVEWVKSNRGKTVKGYTNHYWNGITCLQYAKEIDRILEENSYSEGIHTVSSHYRGKNYITKYDLVREISNIYGLNVTVVPYETEEKCDRTLTPDGDFVTTDLYDQIVEMKEYDVLNLN